MQIDPTKITNFNRTDSELQAFALFAIFCAGKNSDYASKCLARLLHKCNSTPFEYLRELGEGGIHNALVASKIGQYGRLTRAVVGMLKLDLKTCSLEDLMAVHGCGPKTSNFILVHSREGYEGCVLDTHILAWLRANGVEDAPKSTPQNMEKYKELSQKWLYLSKIKYPHLSAADRDLLVWMSQSGRLDNDTVEPILPFES